MTQTVYRKVAQIVLTFGWVAQVFVPGNAASAQTTFRPVQSATPSVPAATVRRAISLQPAATIQVQAGQVQAGAPGSIQAGVSGQVVIVDGVPQIVGADGTMTPAPTTGAQPEDPAVTQQKQQVLQTLSFDRRASSILKAWATPPGEDLEESATEGEPVDASATPPAEPPVAAPVDPNAPPEPELTEEQKVAQEAAKKAAEEQAKKLEQQRQQIEEFKTQINSLKRSVTLGLWPDVRTTLRSMTEADQKVVYERLIASLVQGPIDSPRDRSGQIIGEKNVIRATDVLAVGELCPEPKLNDAHVGSLGQLAGACQAEGEAEYAFVVALRNHITTEVPERRIDQRMAARILFAAGRAADAQEFLPAYAEVQSGQDSEAMELFTSTCLARIGTDSDRRTELLEQAWGAAQSLLSLPVPPEAEGQTPEQKKERVTLQQRQQRALQQAVQLVPMIRDDLGEAWLIDSFTREPERGQRLLNGIGSASARSMAQQAGDPDGRLKLLKLQQTALASLFEKVPDRASEWKEALHLMAVNWLREASYSAQFDQSTQRGPMMQRDEFGNLFWTSDPYMGMQQMNNRSGSGITAIPSGRVLDARPSDAWLQYLEETYRPSLAIATARLHLRVKEEAQAFPQIEMLATTHKDIARELVQEFLNVWAENHDPNNESRRTNIYMFSFGYSQRLSGIPLTRSRQQRNVAELAEWVRRIRKLPIDRIDETWVSSAFAKVYSSAEVYQLKDLEAVFGDVNTLEPNTLSALLETMRGNLNSVWRAPQVQQDAKTNRKKNDIEQEVLNGYASALQMADKGLSEHPQSWKIAVTRSALLHDLNNYQSELTESAAFTEKRREALAGIKQAAETYVAEAAKLKDDELTVGVFNTWFCAALGACDVNQITAERTPMLDQMPLIRACLDSLPEAVREKHLNMFANDLFSRMSSVNPAVKFRYVREGLGIAGDRPQAIESRKLLDYYSDLVTEIQLDAEIDGSPKVGHERPFGVFVSIRHTQAIERESGGFGRYLQNQNSGGGYFYNNGRPNEDYRDKFEKAARESLNEHFEVLSVTFEPESIKSLPLAEAGWRRTPYAYLLLKPRGPEIDRIPPMRLDLDFLDTSGYVVLPVESPAVSLDCGTKTPDRRPVSDLTLTQTLDERQAKDGRLMLELKAVGKGLVPEIGDMVKLDFEDFEIASTEDNGVLISRFDPDSEEPVIISERIWTLTLKDRAESTAAKERKFAFPESVGEFKEVVYQVYDDADLKTVEQKIALNAQYEKPKSNAMLFLLAIPVLLGAGVGVWMLVRRPKSSGAVTVAAFRVPDEITPFTVLRLLKDIEQRGGVQQSKKTDLTTSINRIERYYFADQKENSPPDLQREALNWLEQVNK